MEKLIGKKVEALYVEGNKRYSFEGTVTQISGKLIFLTDVQRRNGFEYQTHAVKNQIINTGYYGLFGFELL